MTIAVQVLAKGPNEGRYGVLIASSQTHPIPEGIVWVQYTTPLHNPKAGTQLKASPYRLSDVKYVLGGE